MISDLLKFPSFNRYNKKVVPCLCVFAIFIQYKPESAACHAWRTEPGLRRVAYAAPATWPVSLSELPLLTDGCTDLSAPSCSAGAVTRALQTNVAGYGFPLEELAVNVFLRKGFSHIKLQLTIMLVDKMIISISENQRGCLQMPLLQVIFSGSNLPPWFHGIALFNPRSFSHQGALHQIASN